MGVAAAQDALVTVVSQALGIPVQLGMPVTMPPGLAAYVGLGWREEPRPMDASGTHEKRVATLHVVLTYVAAVPAGVSPTAPRNALVTAVETVQSAIQRNRTLSGTAVFAEAVPVDVPEPQRDENGMLYAEATIDVQVTGYVA